MNGKYCYLFLEERERERERERDWNIGFNWEKDLRRDFGIMDPLDLCWIKYCIKWRKRSILQISRLLLLLLLKMVYAVLRVSWIPCILMLLILVGPSHFNFSTFTTFLLIPYFIPLLFSIHQVTPKYLFIY